MVTPTVADVTTIRRVVVNALDDVVFETVPRAEAEPGGPAWEELNTVTRIEISQATGMLVGQLDVDPVVALVRLRAHAFATGRTATDVARDILEHRLVLEPDDDRI